MNDESTMKCGLPASIEIKIFEIFDNAEPTPKSPPRGIVNDLRSGKQNRQNSMRHNRPSFSNEIDESDVPHQKHNKQRPSTPQGTVINLRVG
jgi:hypothetical protein